MKLETLKLNSDFVGQAYYEGQGDAPAVVNGQRGQYVRHILNNERHGQFHVVTLASAEVFPHDALVEIIEPLFFEDYVNGRNVAPAVNVFAKGLKVVGGQG